jgi:hypothetical protein
VEECFTADYLGVVLAGVLVGVVDQLVEVVGLEGRHFPAPVLASAVLVLVHVLVVVELDAARNFITVVSSASRGGSYEKSLWSVFSLNYTCRASL